MKFRSLHPIFHIYAGCVVDRQDVIAEIRRRFRHTNGVILLGPRQCGKTTLARSFFEAVSGQKWFLDMEDPTDLAKFDNPKLFLEDMLGLIVLDEIHNRPDLFPVLRVLLDQKKMRRKFLLLGSASPELLRQGAETLAGRVQFMEIRPFNLSEAKDMNRLWGRGGFPLSYLAKSESASFEWRRAFIETFLQRDIRSLGFDISPGTMRKFWMMLTHYHGGMFNSSEIGKALGFSDKTIRRYLDILTGTFMIREIRPWYENLSKRQVKTPKIFFRDSGLFHALLDIRDYRQLKLHPKLGLSWEGFALEEVIACLGLRSDEVYFWSTHNETDLDLFFLFHGKRIGIEVKFTDAPALTRSMKIAMTDLKLARMIVVYPGKTVSGLRKM
jgi:predicted AAA+ superfamily ATPase